MSHFKFYSALKQDEYLKALPKMIDDDIQEKRWLHEIKYFEGNPFKSKEIVFHVNEVKNRPLAKVKTTSI